MKICFFFHKWELRLQAGVHDYLECTKCGTRKYKKRLGYTGYSPIDWEWLKNCPNQQYTNDHGPH